MAIADDPGKIGIAAGQGKDDAVIAPRGHFGDAFNQGLGGGHGICAHVMAERGHHIRRCHGAPVMEFEISAQLERPDRQIARGLKALGKVGCGRAIDRKFGQRVAQRAAEHDLSE